MLLYLMILGHPWLQSAKHLKLWDEMLKQNLVLQGVTKRWTQGQKYSDIKLGRSF